MVERITEEFFKSGVSFDEFIKEGTDDEAQRMELYHRKVEKKFTPEELRIDTQYPVNLLVLATTWCWDSQTNIPIIARIGDENPNINVRFFNKDKLPFLARRINGGEKVPQVLFFTKDYYYLDRWVERSTKIYQLYGGVRAELGWEIEKSDFAKEYRKRFLKIHKELEESVIHEIKEKITRADAMQMATGRFAKKN